MFGGHPRDGGVVGGEIDDMGGRTPAFGASVVADDLAARLEPPVHGDRNEGDTVERDVSLTGEPTEFNDAVHNAEIENVVDAAERESPAEQVAVELRGSADIQQDVQPSSKQRPVRHPFAVRRDGLSFSPLFYAGRDFLHGERVARYLDFACIVSFRLCECKRGLGGYGIVATSEEAGL